MGGQEALIAYMARNEAIHETFCMRPGPSKGEGDVQARRDLAMPLILDAAPVASLASALSRRPRRAMPFQAGRSHGRAVPRRASKVQKKARSPIAAGATRMAATPFQLLKRVTAVASPFVGLRRGLPRRSPGVAAAPDVDPPAVSRGGGASGGVGIVWFRNDLRIEDNDALTKAVRDCSSVVPVFVYDKREYARGAINRVGPYRAKFTNEAVQGLRKQLKRKGSDLLIRVGKPENVLARLADLIGARCVYCQGEVSSHDQDIEDKVEASLKRGNASRKLELCWGASTLHDIAELPFSSIKDLPTTFGAFSERIRSVGVKQTEGAPRKMRPWPKAAEALNRGRVPTFEEVGMGRNTAYAKGRVPRESLCGERIVGGEEAGARYLKRCVRAIRRASDAERERFCRNIPNQIAPWLALGCVSTRMVYKAVCAATGGEGGEGSGCGLGDPFTFEMLWRDFFRFAKLKTSGAGSQRLSRYRGIKTA